MRGSHCPDRGHCPDALMAPTLFLDSYTREDDTNLTAALRATPMNAEILQNRDRNNYIA